MATEVTINLPRQFAAVAKAFCAKDDARPVLNTASVTYEPEHIRVVAADGFMMGILDMEVPYEDFPSFTVLVDLDTIVRAEKMLGQSIPMELRRNQNDRWFLGSTVRSAWVQCRPIEGTFPDATQIVKSWQSAERSEQPVQLNVTLLGRLAAMARSIRAERITFHPTGRTSAAVFDFKSTVYEQLTIRAVVMPMVEN